MEKYFTRSLESNSQGSIIESTAGFSSSNVQRMGTRRRASDSVSNSVSAINEDLVDQYNRMENQLFTRSSISSGGTSRYYLSDVIVPRSREEHQKILQGLYQRIQSHTGEFGILTDHADHIHLLHDCAYSNRSCRCTWLKTFPQFNEIFRGKIRKARLMSSLKRSDWENVIYYYLTGGRKCIYFKFRGATKRIPVGIEDLPNRRYRGEESAREMEIHLSESDGDIRHEFSRCESSGEIDGESSRGNPPKRQFRVEVDKKIQLLMYKYPVTPMKGILSIMEWLDDSDLQQIRGESLIFKNCFEITCSKICRWKLHEFKSYYADPAVSPKFGAGYMPIDSVYYDTDLSFDILKEILNFQFNDDDILIYNFVLDLWKVLERYQPKLNTLLIHGPPSSGKNFFIDCFLDYLLVKGNLGNPNKNNQFAYQECFGKRVILWNEPNYESSEIDNLKMLLGGDVMSARVKNKDDAAVYRTPIVILTNNIVSIMNNPAFKDRIAQYKWRQMPSLKTYKCKPYPLAIEKVFELYIPTYYCM